MTKSIPRIQLFIGEDRFRLEQEITNVRHHFFKDETDVDVYRFDAQKEEEIKRALDVLNSFSLITPNELIIVESIDKVLKESAEILESYLKKPRGDTPFIMIAASLSKIPAAIKKLVGKENTREIKSATTVQLRKWISQQCQHKKIEIEPAAIDYLLEACCQDSQSVQSEFEKLSLWAMDSKKITLQDCQRLVIEGHSEKIWTLTDAVAERNSTKALKAFHELLAQGDDAFVMLATLASTFRRILQCKFLIDEKTPLPEMKKKTGMKDFPLKKNTELGKKIKQSVLQGSIRLLLQADKDLKGAKGTASEREIIIERLILDLCRGI